MALSDDERQRLAQLEASLAEDDPFLANTLRGTKLATPPTITSLKAQPARPKVSGRLAGITAVGAAAGVGLLIAGMSTNWSVSVAGFILMLVSALFGIGSLRLPGKAHSAKKQTSRPGRVKGMKKSSEPFMDKLEERWRRRQDGR